MTPKSQPATPRALFRLPETSDFEPDGFNNKARSWSPTTSARGAPATWWASTSVRTRPPRTPGGLPRHLDASGQLADYLVVNVSSPTRRPARPAGGGGTPPDPGSVKKSTTTPVLVKIAPDLSDEDIDAVADLAVELELAGIWPPTRPFPLRAENTRLQGGEDGRGGISGAPWRTARLRCSSASTSESATSCARQRRRHLHARAGVGAHHRGASLLQATPRSSTRLG
ncbi:hypothetical protein I6H52_00030 [Corynebacterium urealyticum]|nr:hypothetical protein I6H52_00030 [Corynebacterium urealyticum]